MELGVKPKRYYIATAIVSFLSLGLFLANGVFKNVDALITSSFIGLLPFVIDDFVFLDDTASYKSSKEFKLLRGVTIAGIVMIGIISFVWLIKSLGFIQIMDPKDTTYLGFKPDGMLNMFNSKTIYKVLSVNIILPYHVVTFLLSVAIRVTNAHFYRLRIEKIRKSKST